MKGRCNKKSLKECMLQVIKLFIQKSDNTTKYLRTDIELHKGGGERSHFGYDFSDKD